MKPHNLPSLERIKELVDYNQENGLFTWKVYRGGKAKAGTPAGSIRVDGYMAICIDKKSYFSSRIAWYLSTGIDPVNFDIDHIDGNKMNNRFSNLRLATESQNCSNRKRRADNTSGFKGVYRMGKKWAANITANKCKKHLGVFDTPEIAYAEYLKHASSMHGEFARSA